MAEPRRLLRSLSGVRIVDARLVEARVPLRQPPGGNISAQAWRATRVLHLEAENGETGQGEASWVDWLDAKDVPGQGEGADLLARIRAGKPTAESLLAASLRPPLCSSLRSGLQCALFDLEARRRRVSMAAVLERSAPAIQAPLSALVGEAGPEAMAAEASALSARGFASFKVKVGRSNLADDLARVHAVRKAIGPAAELRLDANRAWNPQQASTALAALARFAPRFVEEPLACAHDLASLGDEIPVALDESVRNEKDLEGLLACCRPAALVLKLERVGGPVPALRLAARARQAGMAVVFTDSIEGPVGREATVQVALAATPPGARMEAVGLGGLFLLDEDGAGDDLAEHAAEACSKPRRASR